MALVHRLNGFLPCWEGKCSASLKEMRINYGLINTDSAAEPRRWAMSLVGTRQVPPGPSSPTPNPPVPRVGAAPGVLGGPWQWGGVGRAGWALGEAGIMVRM